MRYLYFVGVFFLGFLVGVLFCIHRGQLILKPEKSIHVSKDDPYKLISEAKEYRRRGNIDNALSCIDRAIKAKPDFAEAYYLLGVIYLHDKGDMKKAFSAWKTFLKLSPDDPRATLIRRTLEEVKKRRE